MTKKTWQYSDEEIRTILRWILENHSHDTSYKIKDNYVHFRIRQEKIRELAMEHSTKLDDSVFEHSLSGLSDLLEELNY